MNVRALINRDPSQRSSHLSKDSDEVTIRILGVITYGYSFDRVEGMRRKRFLDVILKNYLAMKCDAGYTVSTLLTVYETEANKNWHNYLNASKYACDDGHDILPVDVELFPFRALTKNAYGTAGDLAIRHREILSREKHNYDYFVVQEDDVSYTIRNIEYYIRSMRYLSDTNYYPTFTDYEKSRDRPPREMVDWRLRNGRIFLINGTPHFTWHYPMPTIGRGYMISSELLCRIKDETAWKDPNSVIGEFNPLVATSAWISNHFNKRLVVPLHMWEHSMVHHMPNKYLRINANDSKYLGTTKRQSSIVFRSCLRDSVDSSDEVHFAGDNCYQCLQKTKDIELKISLGEPSSSIGVNAIFSCHSGDSYPIQTLIRRGMKEFAFVTLLCIVSIVYALKYKKIGI